jgi:hypothetical protein
MGARRYDYAFDDDEEATALETCLHDQQRYSRPSRASGLYRLDVGTATTSGVVPINRTSAPSPPTIPRAGTVPIFVAGERISAFMLHEPSKQKLPVAKLLLATVMFLAMTVFVSVAYYR